MTEAEIRKVLEEIAEVGRERERAERLESIAMGAAWWHGQTEAQLEANCIFAIADRMVQEKIRECFDERERAERWKSLACELADIVDAHRQGEDCIDAFTTQPVRSAIRGEGK